MTLHASRWCELHPLAALVLLVGYSDVNDSAVSDYCVGESEGVSREK